jgi:hypothetical protein
LLHPSSTNELCALFQESFLILHPWRAKDVTCVVPGSSLFTPTGRCALRLPSPLPPNPVQTWRGAEPWQPTSLPRRCSREDRGSPLRTMLPTPGSWLRLVQTHPWHYFLSLLSHHSLLVMIRS